MYQSGTGGTGVPVYSKIFLIHLKSYILPKPQKLLSHGWLADTGHPSSKAPVPNSRREECPCSITIINPTHQEYLCAPLQLSNVHLIDHSHQGEDQPGPSSSAPQSQLGVPMTNLCVSPPCGSLCEPHSTS